MKLQYDIVFVTHLPAFYKINLYNAIAKKARILVIFVASASKIRTTDFTQGECRFDYKIINDTPFENRSKVSSLFRFYKLLKDIQYNQIIVGGWDLIEYWFLIFKSSKSKNALALESSLLESNLSGLKGALKKLFLKRISTIFPSGQPHAQLCRSLQFNGEIKITGGVGIFQYQEKNRILSHSFNGKFLYVGRLAAEKNLAVMIQAFKHFPTWSLTLIGSGPELKALQAIAPSNVHFAGYVPNEALAAQYQAHDVFILPSKQEPWGLVVEEALYYGLPVIVSNKVGCAQDLVVNQQVGSLFEPSNESSLIESINQISTNYAEFKERVNKIDFHARDLKQVGQYVQGTR